MPLTKDEILETIKKCQHYEKEYRARNFINIADSYLALIKKYEGKLEASADKASVA
jgi:hypothetical protein